MAMKRMVLLLLACSPMTALGATYKCVDAQGRVSYSQTAEPGKRCVEAVLPPVQVIPAQPSSQREGGPPARDDGAKEAPPQAAGKDLAEARKALDEARKKLAEQEAVRYGHEKNYQRVLDRLKPFQDEVAKAEERLRQLGGTP
jgi:hypothetical protein